MCPGSSRRIDPPAAALEAFVIEIDQSAAKRIEQAEIFVRIPKIAKYQPGWRWKSLSLTPKAEASQREHQEEQKVLDAESGALQEAQVRRTFRGVLGGEAAEGGCAGFKLKRWEMGDE
eukprot:g6674.t1